MDFGCVSLHGAVLGACSSFISSLLTENNRISSRDETVLFLPDSEKDDFVALVKVFDFHDMILEHCQFLIINRDR